MLSYHTYSIKAMSLLDNFKTSLATLVRAIDSQIKRLTPTAALDRKLSDVDTTVISILKKANSCQATLKKLQDESTKVREDSAQIAVCDALTATEQARNLVSTRLVKVKGPPTWKDGPSEVDRFRQNIERNFNALIGHAEKIAESMAIPWKEVGPSLPDKLFKESVVETADMISLPAKELEQWKAIADQITEKADPLKAGNEGRQRYVKACACALSNVVERVQACMPILVNKAEAEEAQQKLKSARTSFVAWAREQVSASGPTVERKMYDSVSVSVGLTNV